MYIPIKSTTIFHSTRHVTAIQSRLRKKSTSRTYVSTLVAKYFFLEIFGQSTRLRIIFDEKTKLVKKLNELKAFSKNKEQRDMQIPLKLITLKDLTFRKSYEQLQLKCWRSRLEKEKIIKALSKRL